MIILFTIFLFSLRVQAQAPLQGFTHVQGAGSGLTFNTATATLSANPTAGDLVVCAAWTYATGTMTAQDGNGNSYTLSPQSPSPYNNSGQVFLFYLLKAPATASAAITVNTTNTVAIWCDEFSVAGGVPAFDQDATGSGSNSTNLNAPTITPAVSKELLYNGCGAASPDISSASSPWTNSTAGAAHLANAAYAVRVSSSLAVNYTQAGSGDWSCAEMAFKLVVPRGFQILQ